VARGLLFLQCRDAGRSKDGVLRHYEERMLEVAMWMRCCAACRPGTQESKAVRSHLLRVRLGMVTAMANVIEYYVPEKFGKRSGKWIPSEQRLLALRESSSETG
jgi:hypothetical protein